MNLIFGGAYQGKTAVAQERYGFTPDDCFECINDIDFSHKVINKFENYLLYLIKNDINPTKRVKEILPKIADKTIIIADISNGIVPLDPLMREWREAVGRCMVILAKNSQEVIRVYCGIPTKIL